MREQKNRLFAAMDSRCCCRPAEMSRVSWEGGMLSCPPPWVVVAAFRERRSRLVSSTCVSSQSVTLAVLLIGLPARTPRLNGLWQDSEVARKSANWETSAVYFLFLFCLLVCLFFKHRRSSTAVRARPRSELLHRLQTTAVLSTRSTRLAQLLINGGGSLCLRVFLWWPSRATRVWITTDATARRHLGVGGPWPWRSSPGPTASQWSGRPLLCLEARRTGDTTRSRWNFTPAVKHRIPDVLYSRMPRKAEWRCID